MARSPDLDEALIAQLVAWAVPHDAILELWLFGSRAKGTARPDSDVDLAIVLHPPAGGHDWAAGAYLARGDAWQRELGAIAGRHVSLEATIPGSEEDRMVRTTGIRLWSRL